MTYPGSVIGEGQCLAICDLAGSCPPGHFVEVGVYKGGSAWWLLKKAREQDRELHLYDTFSGMPFSDPEIDKEHGVGDFGDTKLADVQELLPDAIFHVGVFPDTFDVIGPIAFAHVDCDQYQSVHDCIDVLWPHMVSGGIMIFDDYEHTTGAKLAVDRSFSEHLRIKMESGRVYVVKP
jgi:O-methyltransferase